MSKVLVVDDEPRYREHITRVLERDAHEVRSAASGRDAIALGSRFRPDYLIADWMLQDHIHGLHVSEALRAIVPDMQTILITGYPSYDLRNEAQRHWVSKFIEKPFELKEIQGAVSESQALGRVQVKPTGIAILEINRRGKILFANQAAREILDVQKPGADDESREHLAPRIMELIPSAEERWTPLDSSATGPRSWLLRVNPTEDAAGWLMFLIPTERPHLKKHPVIRTLLGSKDGQSRRWPFSGRTLLIDRDDGVRRVIVAQIERAGGMCHSADGLAAGWRTFERDPEVDLLIIDHLLPGENLPEFVRRVRSRRPGVVFLGTSGDERSAEFNQCGIERFLQKPWTVVDLLNMLSSCFGNRRAGGLPNLQRKLHPGDQVAP